MGTHLLDKRLVRLVWVILSLWSTASAEAQPPILTVDAPPALQGAAERVRRIELEPLERSLAAAGLPMPQRIFVTMVPWHDPWAARTPHWIVGLASGTSQIVIFPERIGPYPHDSLETVVRHEIVHLALNTRAARRPLPRWFHEGVAVTLESGWSTRDEMRLLLAALDPPSMADIGRLFSSTAQPDTSQAYLLSAALVDEIRQRHGLAVLGEIAGHVGNGLTFDVAFQTATGEAVEAAAHRAWRGYRRLSRWFPVVTSPSAVWTFILLLAGFAFALQLRRRRERRRRWDDDEPDAGDDWPHEDPEDDGRT